MRPCDVTEIREIPGWLYLVYTALLRLPAYRPSPGTGARPASRPAPAQSWSPAAPRSPPSSPSERAASVTAESHSTDSHRKVYLSDSCAFWQWPTLLRVVSMQANVMHVWYVWVNRPRLDTHSHLVSLLHSRRGRYTHGLKMDDTFKSKPGYIELQGMVIWQPMICGGKCAVRHLWRSFSA